MPTQPRGIRNEQRWGEVLETASEVFGERGYPAASIQEIAERLGIAKGSLYYYARTKEDLLFEILKRAHDKALTFIREEPSTQHGAPPQRLERFIRRWMEGIRMRQVFRIERRIQRLSRPLDRLPLGRSQKRRRRRAP